MTKITITKVGPIKYAELDLKKVLVIMGPQASGKSTIAKIISFFQWVEKRYILDGKFKDSIVEQLINFHRISKTYFSKNSHITYESDYLKISQKGNSFELDFEQKENKFKYLKSKNIYIPAERNFVSVIPHLGKYNETNDNIMSFLYDWYDAKKNYTRNQSLKVLNLPISYYFDDESEFDTLKLNDSQKNVELKNASSGLQSMVPLTTLIDYLTEGFYDEIQTPSINEKQEIINTFISNYKYIIYNKERIEDLKNSLENNIDFNFSEEEINRMLNLLTKRSTYYFTNFIIEEPEQNLFPETQRDLVYFLFERLKYKERNHSAIITTHSPYILYAINNCLMGDNIKESVPDNELQDFLSYKSWITPSEVSIWEIENGELKSIKDEKSGTVAQHYFNKIMNTLMDEYYEMLNFYEV